MTRLLLPTLALLLVPAAAAQPTLQIAGAVAVPQGEFGDALGSVGGGISATFLYQIPRTPVAFGVEGTGLLYGYESRRVPFSLTIPDVTVDVQTTNNLGQALGVVRLQVPSGPVRPYVDGVAGVNALWTQTSVDSQGRTDRYGYYDDQPIASSTNYNDAAFAYGAGAGMQVRLHSGYGGRGRPTEVLLDANVRYVRGGGATYLGRGDIERDRGRVTIYPRRSRTDLLIPRLGVTVVF